jgi:hypothetical protein
VDGRVISVGHPNVTHLLPGCRYHYMVENAIDWYFIPACGIMGGGMRTKAELTCPT